MIEESKSMVHKSRQHYIHGMLFLFWPINEFNLILVVLITILGRFLGSLHRFLFWVCLLPSQALLKEGPILTLFCARIHYLQMHMEGLFDFLVPAMVCFFRGMPSLNTLYLKSDQITFHPEARVSKKSQLFLVHFSICSFLNIHQFFSWSAWFLVAFPVIRVWHGILEIAKPCFY